MDKKQINKAITKLGPWHQRYEMNGKFTTESTVSDKNEWDVIRSLIKEDILDGIRILDLGSSSGYFSALMALDGAEVLAVDPEVLHIKQAKWTKHFFEETENFGELLNISFSRTSALELDYSSIGHFDYILASCVLDHTNDQKNVIFNLCSIADNVIVRTDNDNSENSIAFYNAEFHKNDFYMTKKIIGERPVILYKKLVKAETDEICDEVMGSEFFKIKSVVRRYFSLDANKVYRLSYHKYMYRVVLTNNTSIKLEIYDVENYKAKNMIRYHKILTKKVKYPRFIGTMKTPTKIFKATRWIDGENISKEWDKNPDIFKDIGRNMAELNSIMDPVSEQYLSFLNFNPEHMIKSKKGTLFFISNRIKPINNVDRYIARLLCKEVRVPEKIHWFLYGYKKVRPVEKIKEYMKDLEQNNEINSANGDENELSRESENDSNTEQVLPTGTDGTCNLELLSESETESIKESSE